jgi:hypothetical protein
MELGKILRYKLHVIQPVIQVVVVAVEGLVIQLVKYVHLNIPILL